MPRISFQIIPDQGVSDASRGFESVSDWFLFACVPAPEQILVLLNWKVVFAAAAKY